MKLSRKFPIKKPIFAAVVVLLATQSAMALGVIDKKYERAIVDTAVMKQENERVLPALGHGTERFVVWTDYTGYQPNDNYAMPINLFVARASEMKAACRKLRSGGDSGLKENINKLLGLPLYDAPQQFVELNIAVDQFNNANIANYSDSTVGQALFRPCSNPDVHGDSCGMNFPADANDQFKLWIYQKTRQSYHESIQDPQTGKIQYGYPWTDLGYTYNWGAASTKSKVGVTEFVVKKGANVQVVRQPDGTAYRSANSFCR